MAAALRFAGLGHHLAHDPMDFDEMNNFVEPILRMWRTGSADPTVYSGYPGFFNWLAFVPVGLGQRLAGSYGAYVGGRALVACFGVANVWLAYRACRAFVGPGPSLLGAALMAVSRGSVRAAHAITPDVLVATATLALLLVVQRATGRRGWIGAGVLCGAATAVKYTGLLTLPLLLVGLWLRPERRRSLPIALAGALVTFG
ncbi:MAG: ArnT family glycosyltransferase, partial [Vicinamibacteria bacterium]